MCCIIRSDGVIRNGFLFFCLQCDRLAADMAIELKKSGVASISLWPGAVQTELVSQLVLEKDSPHGANSKVRSHARLRSLFQS